MGAVYTAGRQIANLSFLRAEGAFFQLAR